MNDLFGGVLVTKDRKHLLVDCEKRRTACGLVMRTGKVYGLSMWGGYAPLCCPKCAKKTEKQHDDEQER